MSGGWKEPSETPWLQRAGLRTSGKITTTNPRGRFLVVICSTPRQFYGAEGIRTHNLLAEEGG